MGYKKNNGTRIIAGKYIIEYEYFAKGINAQNPKFREIFGSGALGTVKRQFTAVLSSEVKVIDCRKEPPKWQRDGILELAEF